MKRIKTILIVVLVITNLIWLIYAFDRHTLAQKNLEKAMWQQRIADSASVAVKKETILADVNARKATEQAELARLMKMKYDSLLKVCR